MSLGRAITPPLRLLEVTREERRAARFCENRAIFQFGGGRIFINGANDSMGAYRLLGYARP